MSQSCTVTSNPRRERHPDTMGVSDGMGAHGRCIPMVNKTDATPVKFSDGYSIVALLFNVKDQVRGYDGNGIWYKHRALSTGQWP